MGKLNPADTGWADEVQQLILHGRDREAVELAAQHLRNDPTEATSPTRRDITIGPLEQLAELEPLLGHVASGITASGSPRSAGAASDRSRIPLEQETEQ